ncbi:hypothetical protein B0J12DRAFT_665334 [Macrophomina phaseolina]|uniref:BZIP domain-containing protein n=1 Tax=Macrophomina phaseolina TaxID=35725 RepID=A0ABQ8G8P5_9PEZI|nr:hypothetical protein B0J12DRAFT_665334 [Macrophomina phaseolina]
MIETLKRQMPRRPPTREEQQRRAAEAERKRRSSSAASARFRARQKHREEALAGRVRELRERADGLGARVQALVEENEALKEELLLAASGRGRGG